MLTRNKENSMLELRSVSCLAIPEELKVIGSGALSLTMVRLF